jgi:Dolichyl-phosphate-mannose-protein mannosyltransferase
VQFKVYAMAFAASVSIWFIAIRAPLWLDETVSIFLIRGGFAGIMSRQVWPDAPAYSCILWLWTKATGRGEITLRILSVLVMLGAVYLLYRAARGLFERDVAIIAAVVFCLHPIVIFASIDIRPYAFAVLAINASILFLVQLRNNKSNWLAALFGFSAACIVYLQLLFAVILPALAICFVALIAERRVFWRQLGVAMAAFALAFLPVLPRLQYMFRTRGTHVFSEAPRLAYLGQTLAQKRTLLVLVVALLIAAAVRRLDLRSRWDGWLILLCLSLGLVPILILYGISVGTSIHVFAFRYRLVAVPGVALCWAFVLSRINSQTLRWLCCVSLVLVVAYHYFSSASFKNHDYTWKYALEFAQTNASPDHAPVLICSDLPEADYMPMPTGSAIEESGILAPLSYYELSVPVVPLPRTLNHEAIRAGSRFLQEAAQRHERFLAMGFVASYNTLAWLASNAAGTHDVRELGVFDGVKVLEFKPRIEADAAR